MSRPIEVTLLTQIDCSFCDTAKEILARAGEEYPLQVNEIDLTTAEGQHLGTSAGVLFAPGVLLDGEPLGYGRLSERRLRRGLDRRISIRDRQARAT